MEALLDESSARFLIQTPNQGMSVHLSEAQRARIDRVADVLDTPAFYRTIQQCSAVLVPYDPQAYYLRTSHVLVEALGLARPVVTTEGTWMAAELRRFDPQPGVIMADYSEPSLVAACRALLADLPAKLAAAAQAAPAVRARHDPTWIGRTLIAPAGAPG